MRDRQQRKLAAQLEELRRADDREALRRRAELIKANLYRISRGDRSLECEDYYEPDCPTVRIELDPLKTPQQNAAALFQGIQQNESRAGAPYKAYSGGREAA